MTTKKNSNNSVNTKYTIIKDRIEIYKDFTLNLLSYIYDYYLDKETLYLDQDIHNHFMFCYKKTCSDFLKEDIDFRKNNELIKYFYTYYYHHFYKSDADIPQKTFIEFWETIFNIENPQSKNTFNVLIEIYNVFDQSISTERNILELV